MLISNFSRQGCLYIPVLTGFSRKQSLKQNLCDKNTSCINTSVGVQSWENKSRVEGK